MSQGVRGFGPRRCRYIGLAKARLQHVATAAAINVYRISDWLGGVPRAGTRTSPFVRLVGPMRPDVSWQAQADEGFDIAHFAIDWEAERVTCPEGKTSILWKPGRDRWGNEVIHTEFARRECQACPSRPLCTRATTEGREMTLRPRELHEALQAARR